MMKRCLFLIVVAGCIIKHGGAQVAWSQLTADRGTLTDVQQLTEDEQKQLAEAQAKITDAQVKLETLKIKIARDHKMSQESWMEWSSWVDFDGKFILRYFRWTMISGTSLP